MAEYIDREELLKDIEDSVRFSTRNGVSAELRGAHKIVDRIKSAPTVDVVEVKHGYWVKNAPNPEAMKSLHELGIAKAMRENSIYWTCSCCGKWGFPYSKYCSECGAKMDGERKSEDV